MILRGSMGGGPVLRMPGWTLAAMLLLAAATSACGSSGPASKSLADLPDLLPDPGSVPHDPILSDVHLDPEPPPPNPDLPDLLLDSSPEPPDLVLSDSLPDPETPTPNPDLLVPLHQSVVRSTHNSYSGDYNGKRGTITQQLDAGVRFLEFDFHDSPWSIDNPTYLIGHSTPGAEVWTAGDNPDVPNLEEWLKVIAKWSAQHPNHLPITVLLDSKGNLTDNLSFAQGNPAFLNDLLLSVFGEDALLEAEEVPSGLPLVAGMLGKILVVLSGNLETRTGYLREQGFDPAVAINDGGDVVEVHHSGSGDLWYWTGSLQPDGQVRWHRHGKYDTGTVPCVAINNSGWIVEVHQSENNATLWHTVGKLTPEHEILWVDAKEFDTGVDPTVKFVDLDGLELHEIHVSEGTGKHWEWTGKLSSLTKTIAWGQHGMTQAPLHAKSEGTSGAGKVSVITQSDGPLGMVLRYKTGKGKSGRIRYRQVLFVETQKGDELPAEFEGLSFAATKAATDGSTAQFTLAMETLGLAVRYWQFGQAHTGIAVTFPASDEPYADWYTSYCEKVGCLNE